MKTKWIHGRGLEGSPIQIRILKKDRIEKTTFRSLFSLNLYLLILLRKFQHLIWSYSILIYIFDGVLFYFLYGSTLFLPLFPSLNIETEIKYLDSKIETLQQRIK